MPSLHIEGTSGLYGYWLELKALKSGQTCDIYTVDSEGWGLRNSAEIDDIDISDYFEAAGFQCLRRSPRRPASVECPDAIVTTEFVFYDHANLLFIGRSLTAAYHGDDSISADIRTLDGRGWAVFREFAAKRCYQNREVHNRGTLYMLVPREHGLGYRLHAMGMAGAPLLRSNYTTANRASFDRLVDGLSESERPGGLTLLTGRPGTGKTYFIRGLVHAIPQAFFVVIPSSLVPEIGNPVLLETFARSRGRFDSSRRWPLVLIVEDADSVLVRRASDNIAAISTMLNVTDGLFGSSLNLQVIASTNAQKLDIDSALQRAGRLREHVHFDLFSKEEANACLWEIVPHADPDKLEQVRLERWEDPKVSLADVYQAARDLGYRSTPLPRVKKLDASSQRALWSQYREDDDFDRRQLTESCGEY